MGDESSVGTRYARTRDIVLMAAFLLLLTAALLTLLVQAWPPAPQIAPDGRPEAPAKSVALRLFGWRPVIGREASFFVIVMAAGALGAVVHALRSLYWYVGNRSLRRSWLMMYLLLPVTGALFGLIVYLVLRGGLTSPAGGFTEVNPYGMAAIAALVGLFSQETAEKLRAVFQTLLSPAKAGRDQALPPRVHAVEPAGAPVGSVVIVRGVGLGSASAVRFGAAEAAVTDVTDTRLQTTVPPGASTGRLVVTTPAGSATSPADFTVA
ncbi:IPT/TIG domain-containing protein [Spirillospora sp. NPDC029432]|uniref:IPT/TIG domain-containing protein n=1 Tax=Spirillospora sp. NPDC029432 TaxID=3154599 RepID=UPI003454F9A9